MSRVAKAPIPLPNNVELNVTSDSMSVKGPNGSLTQRLHSLVSLATEGEAEKIIKFTPVSETTEAWAQAGTARAILNNMIFGVTNGFARALELVGVGYRVEVSGTKLKLSLGFSHPVEYVLPAGVVAEAPNNTTIILKSVDKQLVGQVAAEIRAFRPPERYKGKGVRYQGEVIILKDRKKK